MSQFTKRKYVTAETINNLCLPESCEKIVIVLGGRGNNLHEVKDAQGYTFLVTMPTKFRRNVWIKRGDFLLVTEIPEGTKVKAEIVKILYKPQIRYIKDRGQWPDAFHSSIGNLGIEQNVSIFVNTNRPVLYNESDTTSSEEN